MITQELPNIDHLLTRYAIPFGSKVLGAFAVWIVGGLVVRTLQKILVVALQKRHVDPTLVSYANSTAGVIFKLLLLLAILGIFGIETTSFSAILAAAGVAIGVAWSGLLSNFAAGVFLILFRPFKVGDSISAAGVTGIVREIGLFATSIDNAENLRVFVGNNKLFSENILNYSLNADRVAVFKVQLPIDIDPRHAIREFSARLNDIRALKTTECVSGEITEFNPQGTLITMKIVAPIRAYTEIQQDGNEVIYQTLKALKGKA